MLTTMPPRLLTLLELLHSCGDAALATQSVAVPGYPFASALPFATDERHRPLILISRLSEHTQNLEADPRASLLVHRRTDSGELARATVIGPVAPIDADPLLVARYLRYQPEAELFLRLGDFRFFRLEPVQARIIGGFGQAAWLAGERLTGVPSVAPEDEPVLLTDLMVLAPPGQALLGIDAFGLDLQGSSGRRRLGFGGAPLAGKALLAAARQVLAETAAED